MRAYQRGKDTKGDDQEANEGLGNAQKLLKMSKRKDYYKILGIDKGSSEQQIKKAYRKLALVHHPDKQQDPAKKVGSGVVCVCVCVCVYVRAIANITPFRPLARRSSKRLPTLTKCLWTPRRKRVSTTART